MAQGVAVKVVADILGHSQLATTSDLYAHIFPAAHRDAADLMDEILTRTSSVGLPISYLSRSGTA
jgi:integrase